MSNATPSATKPEWTTPEVEELSLEQVADLADLKVAFANTNSSGDTDP